MPLLSAYPLGGFQVVVPNSTGFDATMSLITTTKSEAVPAHTCTSETETPKAAPCDLKAPRPAPQALGTNAQTLPEQRFANAFGASTQVMAMRAASDAEADWIATPDGHIDLERLWLFLYPDTGGGICREGIGRGIGKIKSYKMVQFSLLYSHIPSCSLQK